MWTLERGVELAGIWTDCRAIRLLGSPVWWRADYWNRQRLGLSDRVETIIGQINALLNFFRLFSSVFPTPFEVFPSAVCQFDEIRQIEGLLFFLIRRLYGRRDF
jgi:hypothetical protein